MQILEAIAGRHFLPDSRYFSDSKQQDLVRKNIEAWQTEENAKGEREMLIEGVLALNGDSPTLAGMLGERYPDIAAGIIIRALATNSPVRGQLADRLFTMNDPQVTAFWKHELTSGPTLNDRARAAEALRGRGIDVVPEMIYEWNKFPIQTPAGSTGVLANFLASCDSISAIRVLDRNLKQRPDDMRCWVIRCLGEGSPENTSADTQNAVEQCLMSELRDTANVDTSVWRI